MLIDREFHGPHPIPFVRVGVEKNPEELLVVIAAVISDRWHGRE
jgi:hypothetical protein